MTPEHLLIASAAVLVASALQSATGVGLGLIAGPALVVAMGSASAVHVAILLNLAVSLAFIAGELGEVSRVQLRRLALGTVPGIALGAPLLATLDVLALKLLAALAIVLGTVQLLRGRRRRDGPAPRGLRYRVLGAGLVSGVMSASLAIPGPSAMWGLWQAREPPARVRATLRALFLFSYSAALATHAVAGIRWAPVLETFAWLLPAVVAGVLLGRVAKRRIAEPVLGVVLLASLAVTGAALLADAMIAWWR